ncbi:ADP-glyceromanno-heptose 6-epimerase [Granulicella sp. WH15]|uniref:ADP-glyceromanno-heptose 6-epimerase n=1 Tax=Granulicella sp. WH15 TaxID=2602070 RepID=UPI0013668582|nr:ADP-glyceromanno-heptose 6-epimerase [Granulicella sp. WH15]QHN02812.1 ADP-glyceromanno-heptose 6-epimerase [Granulicella sp. WH15]
MIVITGGAGFIGSNIVQRLSWMGETNLLVVDNLGVPKIPAHPKFMNLSGARVTNYMDKVEFREALKSGAFDDVKIRAILHQGACSDTLEDDGRYMMDNNFTYSKEVLHFALDREIPLVYASTAATYGLSTKFAEAEVNERPLNIYGYSKLVFDNYVRKLMPTIKSTVVGLRYFNVYGKREQHKGRMSSVIHHFAKQLTDTGTIRMFAGSGGYGDGEQRRDFVFVDDLVDINLFFAGLVPDSPVEPVQAVVNAGTGAAHTFNEVAHAVMNVLGQGKIEYIPFPADLENRYQHFTEADIAALRRAGYTKDFHNIEEGVRKTLGPELWIERLEAMMKD